MRLLLIGAFVCLATLHRALAQETSFASQESCTSGCENGSCSAASTVWLCICQAGFTGSNCDTLQSAATSGAPAPSLTGPAPVTAPAQVPSALLDCGVGAHALHDNGTAYCNCDGTNATGPNCNVFPDAPSSPPSAAAPAPSAAYPSAAAPVVSVPSAGPAETGQCPSESGVCTVCGNGVFCANGGHCSTFGGCECVTSGSQIWGGSNCLTASGSVSGSNSSATTSSSSNNVFIKNDSTGSHISGVGVAVIVILVALVLTGIIAGFAFWKARGRTSKFDRFVDQPEIFRGATNNL